MTDLIKSLAAMTGGVGRKGGLCGAGAALLLCGAAGQTQAAQIFWADWGANATNADWTDDSIRKINSDGTGAQTLAVVQRPIGVAVDAANQHVYYASGGAGAQGLIGRVNFDGTGNVTLVPTASLGSGADAQGIRLDLTNGKIYWASYHDGLRRANLDGSNVEVVQAGGASGDTRGHLTLDVPGNKLYAGSPSSQKIYQATPLTAAVPWTLTELTGVVTTGANDLTMNAAGTTFYFADGSGSIKSMNVDGTNPQTLVSGLGFALGVALSDDGNTIFWTERSTFRIGFDDTNPSTPQNPTFIATGGGFGIDVVGVVPEPGALSLLVMAGGALLVRRRRQEG